jgi:hypothetical protein
VVASGFKLRVRRDREQPERLVFVGCFSGGAALSVVASATLTPMPMCASWAHVVLLCSQ